MTDSEKLIQTRNYIRWLFRKLYNEMDIKSRSNHRFFFDSMDRAVNVGVVQEDRGTYLLTGKEPETWHRKGARHTGRYL